MQTKELAPFDLLKVETAPEASKELLADAKSKLGFIPNMYAVMGHSSGLLSTYLHGYVQFRSQTSFNASEQEVVFLSISYVNECHYCMAAHSAVGDMAKVPTEIIDAIRNGQAIPDVKLEALSQFTKIMVEKRGFPAPEDVEAFFAAGYQKEQILDIILAIGVKTFSNYANHIANTEVDAPFAGRKWEK